MDITENTSLEPENNDNDVNADVNDDSINEEIHSILDIDMEQPIASNDISTDAIDDSGDNDAATQIMKETNEEDLDLADYDDLDADVDENDLRALDGLDQDDQQTMS